MKRNPFTILVTVAALVGLAMLLSVERSTTRPRPRLDATAPRSASLETAAAPPATARAERLSVQASGRISAPGEPWAAIAEFQAWAVEFHAAAPGERAALLQFGEARAVARHAAMATLIRSDPREALKRALPFRLRQSLPQSIARFVEERVSGWGTLESVFSTPLPGHTAEPPATFRLTVRQNVFEAFVYGRHTQRPQRRGIAVHGIALAPEVSNPGHRILALAEEPLRILEPEEAQFRLGMPATNAASPPLSQLQVGAVVPTCVDLGGTLLVLPGPAAARVLQTQLLAADSATPGLTPPLAAGDAPGPPELPPHLGGTQGAQRLLMVPVTFVDDPRPPVTQDSVYATGQANNQFMVDNSYHTLSMVPTVTPTYPLAQRKYYYGENLGDMYGEAMQMAADDGYNLSEFDYAYIIFPSIPGVGFGGRSDGLLQGGAGAITHELGHNLGLGHASYWDTRGNKPLPRQPPAPLPPYPFDLGSLVGHEDINAPWIANKDEEVPLEEYGNLYDVMGSGGGHFSAAFKYSLNWLPDNFIRVLRGSSTNRLHPFDLPSLTPGRTYALVVRKDQKSVYWLTHREGYPGNVWQVNGVEVQLGGLLLDTTPGTIPGKADAAVVVGRTFFDPQADLYVTPIAKGGGPELRDRWIDVVVHQGRFPDNRPPTLTLGVTETRIAPGNAVTFTATATDPDGDALAYSWECSDSPFGENLPTYTRTFATEGQYVVRCEISDMKGGVVSEHRVILVGAPATRMMSGRVLDADGRPLSGVRVHNCGAVGATYRVAFTDSQGEYTIPGIPSGTYTNRAFIYGYRTEPSAFFDPIVLSNRDATNLNHVAYPIPRVSIAREQDAEESGTPGRFVVRRTGDTRRELEVAYTVSGTAVDEYHYDASALTNRLIIPEGSATATLEIPPLDYPAGDGTKSVIVTLQHRTNDIRVTFTLTNVVSTQGGKPVTNSVLVATTNQVSIPGWELRPLGPSEAPHWTQTYPIYVMDTAEAELIIHDDDPDELPFVIVSTVDGIATELNNDPGVVLFTRLTGSVEHDLVVHYQVTGTASDDDYLPLPGSVTIPAGESSVRLPIHTANDQLVEGTETLFIAVAPDAAYDSDGGAAALQIADDDLPVVSIYSTDSTADKAGGNSARVTLSRSGDLSQDLRVNYVLTGSAIPGVDYEALPGSAIIPAGRITQDLVITPLPRTGEPGFKTIEVVLADAPNYNIHFHHAAVITLRPELPVLTVTPPSGSASEAGAPVQFTITRAGSTSNSLLVTYAVGGFGAEQYDFAALDRVALIPAGAASVTVSIAPINDTFREQGALIAQESAILQLLPSTNYHLGNPSSGQVMIADDDAQTLPAVEFMWYESTVREDEGRVRVPVRISANPRTNQQPAIIEYRITASSAVPGVNYRPIPGGYGLLTFTNINPSPIKQPPMHEIEGSIQTIAIPILNDQAVSGDLTLVLQLFLHRGYLTNSFEVTTNGSGETVTNMVLTPVPTNAYIGNFRSHTVTIEDVGTAVVRVEASGPVAHEGGAAGAFTFTRSDDDLTQPRTVRYGISGTASSDTDYVGLSGWVTFPPGSNAVVVPLLAVDDPQPESAESVIATVLPGRGYRAGGSATVVVGDNDGPVQFTRQTFSASEADRSVLVAIERTGNTHLEVSVDCLIFDGTATRGLDYLATNATVRFAPGDTSKSVFIRILPDALPESDETLHLVLTNLAGGIPLSGQSSATLILRDEDAYVTFAEPTVRVAENAPSALITVHRLGLTNEAASVRLTTANLSAASGLDYGAVDTVLQFVPGETSRVVSVAIQDDALFEGDETVRLQLSNPSGRTVLGAISNAVLVIADDECTIAFSAATFEAPEYADYASVEVRRFGGTLHPLTVDYRTVDGTAVSAGEARDYFAQEGTLDFAGDSWVTLTNGTGSLVFQPGETNKILRLVFADDSRGEEDETFEVHLNNLRGPETDTLPGTFILGSANLAGSTNVIGGPSVTVVRILDDEGPGDVDYFFDPRQGADQRVLALALQPDGKVALGGEFVTVDGINLPRLARVHVNGYLDYFFNPGTGAEAPVRALALTPDGKLMIGGHFTVVDGLTRTGVARLNADGHLDETFDAKAVVTNEVRALAVQPDGRLLVGGAFTQIAGQARNRLARLATNGTLEPVFVPNLNNTVHALAVQPDGRILVAGAFTAVAGQSRQGICRLLPNGAADTSFNQGSGAVGGPVYAVALQPDGKVLIGGAFTTFTGTSRRLLTRLNPDGTPDPEFALAGTGLNGPVNAVGVDEAGRILIGGEFTQYHRTSRPRIARLLSNGALDESFDPGAGANDVVRALVVQPDGAVVLAGDFTEVNGLVRNRLARLHGNEKRSDASGVRLRFVDWTQSAGHIQLTLTGPAGSNCVIEASAQLGSGGLWIPILTNVLTSSPLRVTDPLPALAPHRYYRARMVQ